MIYLFRLFIYFVLSISVYVIMTDIGDLTSREAFFLAAGMFSGNAGSLAGDYADAKRKTI